MEKYIKIGGLMKVSVALCTFNGEKYIKKQLDSILNQTHKVDEIIVCDDVSSDSTLTILNTYKEKHPTLFKIFVNETNLKSNKNFEKALSLTTGDYIFFSDQDDLWSSEKVSLTIDVFLNNKKTEGVFSNANLIDDNDTELIDNITLWDTVGFFESELKKPINFLKFILINGNIVTGATFCVSKKVKEFCFPFHTNEKNLYHDHWIALLLAERNSLTCINKNLTSYRIHSNQQVGVGNILKRYECQKNNSYDYKLILGFYNPKKFNEFKLITRFIHDKYVYHKNNYDEFFDNLVNKKVENDLFELYNEAKNNMIKKNPFKYFSKKIVYLFKNDNSLTFK